MHHTYYDERFLVPLQGALRACTVYDMIPELFRGTRHYTGSHLAKRRFVEMADLIICISESTRRDLLEIYGEPRGKVVVVPAAVGSTFSPDQDRLAGLPDEYVLYVGGRDGYKDFRLLVDAVSQLSAEGSDIAVVVVGAPFTSDERQLFARLRVERQFVHAQLGDGGLRQALAHCTVLVQTSRYEGFGMTPLEAMASGRPTIVSNTSSMPEVGGDAAAYFDAGNAESLAQVLKGVLDDEGLRSVLSQRGLLRAQRFSTARMAEETAQAYRDVLGL